jgi:KaiC/GvpD/RAD55 family RecA-like ATPase
MSKKLMKVFDEIPGFINVEDESPYLRGIRSPSPSVNFIFGNTHLIPEGASAIFYGPSKSGKSLLANFCVGQLHRDDPEAIAIKFETELREKFQMTPRSMKMFGIDSDRYRCRMTNKPNEIFDFIEKDIPALVQKGMKIKLLVLDSVTDILGRRSMNAKSVDVQQMGDEAATIQNGLKRIKDVLRRYNISMIMVAQERAEMDPVEQMRHKKTKMAGANYLRHFSEYFVYIAPNEAAEGKVTLLGEKLDAPSGTDDMVKNESVSHKIKVQMKASSVGIAKRVGEFTFHRFKGIVNTHEEVFRLGCARQIFARPNLRTYVLSNWPEEGKQTQWTSKEECLTALEQNDVIRDEVVSRVKSRDIEMFTNGTEDQAFIAADSGIDETEESED